MRSEVKPIINVVNKANTKKEQWSYLTSIEYMLKSRLYVDSIYRDANKVANYISRKKCKILDFGTGSGIFAIALSQVIKNSQIFAIDAYQDVSQKDPNFYNTADEQRLIWDKFRKIFEIDFSHYDGRNIPFSSSSFDVISAYAVIEHINQQEIGIIFSEIQRVLKEDGLFFVFKTPRRFAYTEYLAGIMGFGRHEILYGDAEILDILKKNKFNIIEKWKSNMIPEFPDKITNPFYPLLRKIDSILYYSPFRLFAHHNNFVLSKEFSSGKNGISRL